MATTDLVWTLVFLLGVVQGLLLVGILLTRRASNKGPSILLALLVLTFALMISEELIDTADVYERWPHTALSTFTLSLGIGPLILLYARRITRPATPIGRQELLHFTPMLMLGLYMVPFYLLDAEAKLTLLRQGLGSTIDFLVIAKGVHVMAYLLVVVQLTARLLDEADPTTRPHLRWFRRLLLASLLPVVFIHLLHFFPRLAILSSADSDRVGSVILATVIYAFAFAAMKRPFFWGAQSDHEPRQRVPQPAAKYQTSPLDEDTKRTHLDALVTLMDRDQPFRDPDVRLADVATALGVSPHTLSQTINELAGVNFYALMNEYRVKAVQEMMGDTAHDHRNLLALAFDAGFNSKTSFNRVFKASTGLTPSAYRRGLADAHGSQLSPSAPSH